MKCMRLAAVCALALSVWACGRGADPLPPGATLGSFADIEQPESYSPATLYTYIDGGADFYVNQGLSKLYVRRYGHGTESFILELYEMKDASGASRVYQSSRRPSAEREFGSGCIASVTPTEIQFAKGRYYLVGRNEDPMAGPSAALNELCRNVLNRLPGPCAFAAKK